MELVQQLPGEEVLHAIRQVVDHLWEDERRQYLDAVEEGYPEKGRLFCSLYQVDAWLANRGT